MHVITQSCVLFLWMHTLTFVKSQECTLQQFINGPLYDTNFDTSDLEPRYPAGKQIRVSCSIGHSGFFKLICVEGKWQSRGTKCQPKSCGHPGDANFADFHLEKGDDFVFGSQVVYNCHKGYQMVSRTNHRRCMADGWDGVVPVCEAQQCPVIHVDNNVQVIGDPEEATFGNVVRFSCKSSSEILFGPSEVYCNEYGEWSGETPQCKEIKCEVPVIENGSTPPGIQEYKEHEILHFECNSGFKRTEERPAKCTKQGLKAEWSPTPACEPIRCKLSLPPLQGTKYQPAFRNVFTPGETLRVTCESKYWIFRTQEVSVVSTCEENGEWSIRPVCKEVTCSNRREQYVDYWNIYWGQHITLGDTTYYRCRSGYRSTDRTNQATCTRDGWSPNPLCQEITCDRHDILNAIILSPKQKYRIYEQANYVCRDGYEGRFQLTCSENGWSGREQCTEIICYKRDFPNAEIDVNVKSVYKYNDEVTYVCKNGFVGRFTITCGKEGWSGFSNCREITCNVQNYKHADIDGRVKERYSLNEKVEYVCKNRQGRFSLTCGEGGWIGSPQCKECQDAVVPNGFVVGPYNNTLYYTCDEGYKLFTKGWWSEAKCKNSVWTGLRKCIEKSRCGQFPVIPNGEVTSQPTDYADGESVQISCNNGYNAQADHLTCHEGKWSSSASSFQTICTPIAKQCGAPPQVGNAVVLTPYQRKYLSGSEVTYQCRAKYTMEGEATITCTDGKWGKRKIECTAPAAPATPATPAAPAAPAVEQ